MPGVSVSRLDAQVRDLGDAFARQSTVIVNSSVEPSPWCLVLLYRV